MGVAVLLDQFRVAQHLLVDAKPDLDVGLPRRAHAELRHTRPGRVLELESPHQTDGDLLTRETHQVSKGSDHLSLVQVGTQFGGGASVGERLYFLGFDKRPVQVEDKRADHAGSTLQVSPALSKTYEYLCTLRLLSQAASPGAHRLEVGSQVVGASWPSRSSRRSSRVSPRASARRRPPPRPPILLASARSSGVSVVSSCRRYRAAFRLDEPVLIVSSRCAPTMLSTFPEADPGSPRDAAGGLPGSDIAISSSPADVLDLQVSY